MAGVQPPPPPPELVIFCGIQATGKSSFYVERFLHTHVRVSLDVARTRHRERTVFEACLSCGQPVVVDNTNATPEERARYIAPGLLAGFTVVGYYFSSKLAEALRRNAGRPAGQRVPDRGVMGTAGRLVLPKLQEGFSALWYVTLDPERGFGVSPWNDEA
jgi:predicted kinase